MTRPADEVEREVEISRSELDRNMEALKSKMTPGQLFDEAARSMGGAGQQIGSKFMAQAKENPMPLAVMGLGLAWLMTTSRKSEGRSSGGDYSDYSDGPRSWDGASPSHSSRLADAAGGLAGRAADFAADAREGLADKAQAAFDGGRSALGSARDAASSATSRVAQAGRRAQSSVMDTLDGEPLLMGALGLVVGLAVGASLPSTPAENRTLGRMRDKVVDKAHDLAGSGLQQAGEVTKAAYESVKSELQHSDEGEDPAAKAERIAKAGVAAAQEQLHKPH